MNGKAAFIDGISGVKSCHSSISKQRGLRLSGRGVFALVPILPKSAGFFL